MSTVYTQFLADKSNQVQLIVKKKKPNKQLIHSNMSKNHEIFSLEDQTCPNKDNLKRVCKLLNMVPIKL